MGVAYAITFFILIASSSKSAFGCYDSIISFGDSLADTGNFLLLSPPNNQPLCGRPPYGRTFFRRPTGRSSDGRLVVDFISESLGLPLVEPYAAWKNAAEKGGSFSKGVNFAVAGATALDATFFDKRGIQNPVTNASLGVQLVWFKQFLARIPGFAKESVLKACCGAGGPYNYNSLTTCGILPEANCCENPSSYVSWDGVHLTEAAYKWITQGHYTHPHIKTLCPSISGDDTVGLSRAGF